MISVSRIPKPFLIEFITRSKGSASAHPPDEDHELDTVEAHYACLERPCACIEGWVFVRRVVESEEVGEEVEVIEAYACRRCASKAGKGIL